jgi:hypothetical protein
MNHDAIYQAFLRRQMEEGAAFARQSNVVTLMPLPGDPPDRYLVHFEGCKGLVQNEDGRIMEFEKFAVGIWFPEDYLRHVEVARLLTYLGPHPSPFHPNIRAPFLCAHTEPGTSLVDILYVCYELWTWKLYSTSDEGLNHAAAQWSRQQNRNRFPIERRPLKRRAEQTDGVLATAKEAQ